MERVHQVFLYFKVYPGKVLTTDIPQGSVKCMRLWPLQIIRFTSSAFYLVRGVSWLAWCRLVFFGLRLQTSVISTDSLLQIQTFGLTKSEELSMMPMFLWHFWMLPIERYKVKAS